MKSGRQTKKKRAKNAAGKTGSAASTRSQPARQAQDEQPEDAMSKCAVLCQQQRWREAVQLCQRSCARARREGKDDLYATLSIALQKLEFSLRRQMAAALVKEMSVLLNKEYLLDVG
jgi:hypothetical protein